MSMPMLIFSHSNPGSTCSKVVVASLSKRLLFMLLSQIYNLLAAASFPLLWLAVITSHFYSKSFIMANVTTTPAATASAAAAAKLKAAKVAAKALRQVKNEETAKYFAVGMTGIMALFIILRWTRFFYKRYGSKQDSSSKVLGLPIAFTR
jgi:hypothetical protein